MSNVTQGFVSLFLFLFRQPAQQSSRNLLAKNHIHTPTWGKSFRWHWVSISADHDIIQSTGKLKAVIATTAFLWFKWKLSAIPHAISMWSIWKSCTTCTFPSIHKKSCNNRHFNRLLLEKGALQFNFSLQVSDDLLWTSLFPRYQAHNEKKVCCGDGSSIGILVCLMQSHRPCASWGTSPTTVSFSRRLCSQNKHSHILASKRASSAPGTSPAHPSPRFPKWDRKFVPKTTPTNISTSATA